MRKKMLPQEVLKLIACLTMFIDHFGAAIVPHFPLPNMVQIYYACRIIGRIAFPIYCFLLVEGMRCTKNAKRYILRLALGILLAELPFDFLFEGGVNWEHQNVMVTLTLGAILLFCMQKTEKKTVKLLLVLPFAAVAELLSSDYGGWGIVLIAVFALMEAFPQQLLCVALVNYLIPSASISVLGISVSVQIFALAAMVPIALYSGRKLTNNRVIQWGFYLFYPLHLLILWCILMFLG